MGVDVRGGLHTGQVETIEGQLGGVAVHIGARVMALAGDAEILTTRTTRDLVQGTDVVFGERTVHTLKGVEGTWELAPVRSIGALTAPAPLDPETASARQGAIEPTSRRTKRLAIGAVAAAFVIVALAGWLVTRQGFIAVCRST